MSGGVAYVLDAAGDFRRRCNLGMVDVEPLAQPEDVEEVRELLRRHVRYTGSTVAGRILADWDAEQPRFVKVMPRDYKRALAAMRRAREEGIPWERAVMEGAHG
jgi:glutamate synthase (ferredoxin)